MPEIQANNHLTVTPSVATRMLDTLLDSDQPAMIWGEPGIGKSQIARQVAEKRGMDFIDIRLSLLSDVDLRGIPTIVNGATIWIPPDFLPRIDRPTLILFDEMNRGLPSVQNGSFQLVLDRRLGEYHLPPQVRMAAAVNYDGPGVSPMSAALKNRFSHIHMVPDPKDWLKWASANKIDPVVQAFIQFRPELLHRFDPKATSFPSPRSWEFVSKVAKQNADLVIKTALYAGTVGKGPGIEFVAFEKAFRDLPSITSILLNPDTAPIPSGVATVYAVASALSHQMSVSNVDSVITYLDRLPDEYSVFAVRMASDRDPSIQSTHRFIQWGSAHAELF